MGNILSACTDFGVQVDIAFANLDFMYELANVSGVTSH